MALSGGEDECGDDLDAFSVIGGRFVSRCVRETALADFSPSPILE